MKMFRWGGLIGFIVFTVLMVVIGFFFIDGWMKKAIESAGMSMNGAEVNVESVDLTLSPLGFRLNKVEVANAEKPTHNSLELDEMVLDINFPQLFLGNVRINDVTVANVQTNTEREQSAKLAPVKETEAKEDNALIADAKERVGQIGAQFPEPKDIVSEQTENTRKAVKNADQTISESKQSVEQAVDNLPGDAALAAYKQRIAEIKTIDLDSLENIKKSQALVKSVTADIAKDKLAIEQVKINVNSAVRDSKNSVAAIAKAPGEDWDQLKEDYPLNKESALKVAQLLLGESFFEKVDQAKYWYEKSKPWLARLQSDDEDKEPVQERQTGEFVRFYHPDPTARFQLDHALLSLVADNWPWELTIEDVSSHSGDLFKPVKLNLRRGEEGSEALKVSGLLDRENDKSKDTFLITGKGVEFSTKTLSLAGTELKWSPDDATVQGQIVATAGELDGKVSLMFPSNEFSASGSGESSKLVASAVQKINAFSIDIIVSGTVKRPKFVVNSDIDNQLSSAFSDVAKEKYDAWLADVKAQLDSEVAKLRKPVDDALATLETKKQDIEDEIKAFENEVEAEVRSLEAKVEEERKRLEGKAKAELDAAKAKAEAEAEALRKKAEEEKRKAEDAAKKEAEQKLKEEADKLKGKLKF
jgi:uncharacterized protein (TIGR03545 family)